MSSKEYVNCNLCGEDDSKLILVGSDLLNQVSPEKFSVVQCKNCGFTYTNPRPTKSDLKKYYPDKTSYFQPTTSKKSPLAKFYEKVKDQYLVRYLNYPSLNPLQIKDKLFISLFYLKIKKDLDIQGIPSYRPGGKLLEIGCSYGSFLQEMKQLGWDVTGIEPNKKAADYGVEHFNLNIINAGFEELELVDKFDVVIMRMVLEHLTSPSEAFSKIKDILKPGGQLIVIIPDFSGLEFRFFKEYCYALQLPTHLNHFTPTTIQDLATKYDFKVEKITHHQTDKDIVASAQYLKENNIKPWLYQAVSNRIIRASILRVMVKLFSSVGLTSRMTVWMRKAD